MPPSTPLPNAVPLAVVPLRAGKTRLSDVLDESQRAALRAAMLGDVVAALRGAGLREVAVACGDDASAMLAAGLGLVVHRDPPSATSLDGALDAAVRTLTTSPTDARGRTRDVLVVTADLPGLTPGDVQALLGTPGDVVIAPTSDGGTGGLLRRPAAAMRTAYGVNSASAHAALAAAAGATWRTVDLPGFAIDVDTADDLEELAACATLGRLTRRWVTTARARD